MQQKVFNEIRNVIGDDVEHATNLGDLSGLNYLELVIRETLRLYPSVPCYGRKVREDFYLSEIFELYETANLKLFLCFQ